MINDPIFWIALFVAVPVYWILPANVRRIALGFLGLALITYFDRLSAAFLVGMSGLVYAALPSITGGARFAGPLTAFLIAALVGPLVVFKSGVLVDILRADRVLQAGEVIVPLGMSYYVFRLTHVVIDCYRSERVDFTFKEFFSYVFLFTIMPAGPIQRIGPFVEGAVNTFHTDHVLHGLVRIGIGLIKQVVILDYLIEARRSFTGVGGPITLTVLEGASYGQLWLLLVAFYLASLLNLSAYTDVAVGASRLFGFKISENFNYPVIATSLTDFWRRWHITLSGWCQSYVYTPVLGWSRNPYIALVLSFQVMGLWHVLSFNRVGWGLFHAAGVSAVAIHQRYLRRSRFKWTETTWGLALCWLLTQAYVSASWLFVVAEAESDIGRSLKVLGRLLLGPWGSP